MWPEDAGEALFNEGVAALGGRADQRLHRDPAHQGHEHAGSHQGDERLELELDDQEQQEGDARACQEEQAGGVVPEPVQEFIHGRVFLGWSYLRVPVKATARAAMSAQLPAATAAGGTTLVPQQTAAAPASR